MKQQKYYIFLQKQILLMIGLSLIPGLVYVMFGWVFNIALPAVLWYVFLIITSLYGWFLYKDFAMHYMNEDELRRWYTKLKWFMYIIFSSWTVIFVLYVGHTENNLHYISIFTQLGAAVVASTLLVSDKKLFVPILLTLMLPLSLYFLLINVWYGYILSLFSLVFLSVLLYAAYNTNRLLLENYFQAQHDVLTGLYNRRYFMDYIESLQERLNETSGTAYMFLIDLDHFKTINDSLGHDIGDKLLIAVSKRIDGYIRDIFVLARLGGDEFILVSKEYEKGLLTEEIAYGFAQGLLQVIREPYHIDKHHLHISASIGVHKLNPSSLYNTNFIKEVDIALYEAKAQGRDGVIVFNKDLEERVERHLLIEQKLHQAIKEKIIKVYYQPQFDKQKQLSGCEALVRWDDNELGILSPEEFIPISENTGLIIELGSYVIKETFDVLNTWNEKGMIIQNFSINISIRQLLYEPFIKEVEDLIEIYTLRKQSKQKIIFEITEHVFAEDINKVIASMNRLKDLGISFSIDDFGTGYSSLSYLRELPIDEVKIDKAFIAQLDESKKSENMISTIISIAKNFDLNIVAEGIETTEQLDFLLKHECDACQGFYFDEALPQENFEKKYLTI
jgi:diguanylate cyclase (GGDEF)-like protein